MRARPRRLIPALLAPLRCGEADRSRIKFDRSGIKLKYRKYNCTSQSILDVIASVNTGAILRSSNNVHTRQHKPTLTGGCTNAQFLPHHGRTAGVLRHTQTASRQPARFRGKTVQISLRLNWRAAVVHPGIRPSHVAPAPPAFSPIGDAERD